MDEKNDKKSKEDEYEPSFYHFNGKILEIRKATPDITETYFKTRHGIFIKEINLKDNPQEASDIIAEMKDSHSEDFSPRVFTGKESGINCVWGTEEKLDDETREKAEKLLDTPVWDIREYTVGGDLIVHLEGYPGKDIEAVLRSLECLAKKPFQTGGTIEEAINPDLRRRRLDSIIAEAQRLCEEDQNKSKGIGRRW